MSHRNMRIRRPGPVGQMTAEAKERADAFAACFKKHRHAKL